MSIIRAKLRVSEVLQRKAANGTTETEIVKLQAVTAGSSDENTQWSKWTPQGSVELHITNPDAFGKLSSGHEFYLDFTPAN